LLPGSILIEYCVSIGCERGPRPAGDQSKRAYIGALSASSSSLQPAITISLGK